MANFSYLALGDSYTIGEQVSFSDNFPNQTVQLLRRSGFNFYAPEIVAKTGWTTDELHDAIQSTALLENYDVVSLLIGVNNQYRNRTTDNFKIEFEQLLQQAVTFSGNRPYCVFVLSIPDWGVTPFAEGRDRNKIAEEIDEYNYVCESMAKQFLTNYIDITASQRKDGNQPSYLAPDNLHPSGTEYAKWAQQLYNAILKEL